MDICVPRIFQRSKTDAVSKAELDNIPNRPAEIYPSLEARAKNPAVEKEPAAARGWIGELLLELLDIDPDRTCHSPGYNVQYRGRKDFTTLASALRTRKALQDASSLQSFVQNTVFSSADQFPGLHAASAIFLL